MMLNYVKSEWYRIVHGHEFYMFTGLLCALGLAGNLLLFGMGAFDPGFPYATVRFSLSNVVSALSLTFFVAGLLVWDLFSSEGKDGTFKNAVAHGLSRRDLFLGKCLVSTVLGLISIAAFLIVFIGSAFALLEGPGLEPTSYLLQGIAATLPFSVACVVLVVAVCATLPASGAGFFVFLLVVYFVPALFDGIGRFVEPVAAVAAWMPANFFSSEVLINQSGAAEFLWSTPSGLAKCLVTGFAGIVAFGAWGLWRAEKTEL
ncbi:ABC transporter permease [Gordonibacter sp. An230]|uniref:ABC transporter permease n=1 Tax=Gordonibacter sp. An230 TaxID=1965592 RepID=UPI000B39AD51|nr:ABC transporter permease [Gordonibacter sp. An230]OUO91434.1 ABC transporter permease [Gordonibacter sp. An230]